MIVNSFATPSVVVIFTLAAALSACRPAATPNREGESLDFPPVDSSRIPSVDEAAMWGYRHEVGADLNGDGEAENVIIASDVMLNSAGNPLWEDGHRWVVYVESSAGERTLLYGAFVPNGFAEAAIAESDVEDRRRVLVQERTPRRVRILEVEYDAPGTARLSFISDYQIEEWLPGAAGLR